MTLEDTRLLTPAEVASLFRVHPRTVTKWANKGWLDCVRTPGGNRRYSEAQVSELLNTFNRQPITESEL